MASTDWTADTTEHSFPPGRDYRALLEVEAGGGQVTIEYPNSAGDGFLVAETITEDGAQPVDISGWTGWRIVASGGAKYRLTF